MPQQIITANVTVIQTKKRPNFKNWTPESWKDNLQGAIMDGLGYPENVDVEITDVDIKFTDIEKPSPGGD